MLLWGYRFSNIFLLCILLHWLPFQSPDRGPKRLQNHFKSSPDLRKQWVHVSFLFKAQTKPQEMDENVSDMVDFGSGTTPQPLVHRRNFGTQNKQKNYKKNNNNNNLQHPDNHNGMITHLEPDIQECKVKWALGSITTNKASGGDRLPVELFQILKDDAVKVLHSICQQIWKTQQWPQHWKRSVFILIPKKGNAKECSNYCTIALISHASKVMLKIFQARVQQYVNRELPDVQVGFRKGRGTRNQIANICWLIEKAREFQKNLYFCFMTMPKPLPVWITTNCGKFFKRWEHKTTWPVSSETCMRVRKQQLELNMKQQTGSKWGKEYIKVIYSNPAYLTYMQSTSWEMPDGRKHKLESRLSGEISITSDMQSTPSLWQKVRRN